jgi:hypothetical protein
MFVSTGSGIVERNIFSLLIELEVSFIRKPYGQGEFAFKLMGKLLRFEHSQRVRARGLRKSGVEGERRRACLFP